jgi:hypothetical protein
MIDRRIEVARDLARVREALAETCSQEMAGDGLYELAQAEADRRAELMPLRDALRSVHSDVLTGRLHLGRVDA